MWKNKIIGQSSVIKHLSQAMEADSLSHALILSGECGYGGLPIALTLAQTLLCQSPDDNMACGKCKSCMHIDQLTHPDLHMAFPVVGKEGAVRKNITSKDYIAEWRTALASNPYISISEWVRTISSKKANPDINVTECNAISKQLALKAFSGDRKVQIIWMAQYLGNNANKLLKLIEEPPPDTFIILLCDHRDQLLRTVVSRCRVIDINRIQDEEMEAALIQHYSLDQDQAHQISFLAEGNMSKALDFLQSGSEDLMELSTTWMSSCIQHDYNAMRSWSEQFSRYNLEEQRTIAFYTLRLLREILHLNVLGEDHCRLRAQDITSLKNIPAIMKIKSREIEAIHHQISTMIDGISRNLLSRMVMFNTCLSIDGILNKRIA
ncbi:MAG: DNA polymerase-3 subunit delta' [Saprospiraceae bacterium]